MKRSAFTIWGFLLVLVVILVVAALLFPFFAISHGPRPDAYCASNLKQLGLAVIQYTQDNNDCMPDVADTPGGKNTWRAAIFYYCRNKRIYQCPSRGDKSNGPDGFPRSYAANYTGRYSGDKSDTGDGAFAGPGSKPVSLEEIDNPATLIALCEVTRHSTPDFNVDNLAVFDPHNGTLWAGHMGGSNYLLTDGHVKWYKPEDTKDFWHRDKSIPLTPAALAILTNAQNLAGNERDRDGVQ